MFTTKKGAAALSIFSNILVIFIEAGAGFVTGSLSIFAGAINSGMDLFAAVIAYFSVRAAERPPDTEHPYGHGKIESIGGLVEGVLIFVAAALIAFAAVRRLMAGSIVEMTELGIGAMVLSISVNLLVSRHLFKVAKATDSVALEGDARHLLADVYSSGGIIVGLIVVRMSGLMVMDSIVALVVVALIVRSAFSITRQSVQGLLDARLPSSEEERVRATIREHCGRLMERKDLDLPGEERCSMLLGFHEMRTRHSGGEHYIDLHLVLARSLSVEQAHVVCDHLEEDIKKDLPRSIVSIHVEPCSIDCDLCPMASRGS